jgi:hypothetical protein
MANIIITKTCWKCGKDKPATLEYFHKRRVSTDGLQRMCKPCRLENNKKKYVEDPIYYVDYRKNNPDKINNASCRWIKKWRSANHIQKIYKITAPDGRIYIGHTALITIDVRKRVHNTKYRQGKNDAPLLFQSFDKYGYDNHKIELVEELGYSRTEAEEIETYWIQKLNAELNKNKVKKK